MSGTAGVGFKTTATTLKENATGGYEEFTTGINLAVNTSAGVEVGASYSDKNVTSDGYVEEYAIGGNVGVSAGSGLSVGLSTSKNVNGKTSSLSLAANVGVNSY